MKILYTNLIAIILIIVVFNGCASPPTDIVMIKAKIIGWEPHQTFPVDEMLLESYGACLLQIITPSQWRGQVVQILVTRQESHSWSNVGSEIRFSDDHGMLKKYFERETKEEPVSTQFFDSAFKLSD